VFIAIVKKFARLVGVLLLVSFSTFLLMFGNATGIAQTILGLRADKASIEQKVIELGLDRPLLMQFGDWLGGIFTGDLGQSYYTGQAVSGALATRVPVTLTLLIVTLIITTIISVLVGVAAASFGGWFDRVVQFFAGIGAAIPAFIVAVVLVFSFAVALPWFPATGYVTPAQSVSGWIASLALPVAALLVGSIAGTSAQIRGAVLDTLDKDFVRTLRARGIPTGPLLFRHVLRNSSGPGLTSLSLQTIGLLGGAVFVEQVFALPGIGQLANTSAQRGDVPMVMGVVLVTVVMVLCVNLLTDLANTALNPKARNR